MKMGTQMKEYDYSMARAKTAFKIKEEFDINYHKI